MYTKGVERSVNSPVRAQAAAVNPRIAPFAADAERDWSQIGLFDVSGADQAFTITAATPVGVLEGTVQSPFVRRERARARRSEPLSSNHDDPEARWRLLSSLQQKILYQQNSRSRSSPRYALRLSLQPRTLIVPCTSPYSRTVDRLPPLLPLDHITYFQSGRSPSPMFSLWSLFFLTLVTSTLARVGGPARLDALPHTARLELRDTSCPTGNIVGSYWPAWTSAVQSPSTYPWSRAGDLAFYL